MKQGIEDLIKGTVFNIVDENMFDMKVTHVGHTVKGSYKPSERVHISVIVGESILAKRSISDMEKLLKGKEVRCHVLTRDLFGRLVAKVQVL
jgi:hypothetical protein